MPAEKKRTVVLVMGLRKRLSSDLVRTIRNRCKEVGEPNAPDPVVEAHTVCSAVDVVAVLQHEMLETLGRLVLELTSPMSYGIKERDGDRSFPEDAVPTTLQPYLLDVHDPWPAPPDEAGTDSTVDAFCLVEVEPTHAALLREKFASLKGVHSAARTSGGNAVILRIRTKDRASFDSLVLSQIQPDVRHTTSYIVMHPVRTEPVKKQKLGDVVILALSENSDDAYVGTTQLREKSALKLGQTPTGNFRNYFSSCLTQLAADGMVEFRVDSNGKIPEPRDARLTRTGRERAHQLRDAPPT